MRRFNYHLSAVASLLLLGTVAACSDSNTQAGPSQEPSEAAAEAVSIMMDWTATGYHAPFAVALKQGFYSEEGLDVEIVEGQGSTAAARMVGTGKQTFGFVNFGSVMPLIAQGIPIKGVSAIVQKSPTIIASREDADVQAPLDLVGKTIGRDPSASDAQMIPLFLGKAGIDVDQVSLSNTTSSTNLQLLARGRIDAALFQSIFAIPIFEEENLNVNTMYFADYDLNTLGYTIVTHNDVLADDPEMVERFTRASLKGWEYANENPEEAIDALVELFPSANKESALKQFELTQPLFHTKNTESAAIGCTDEGDVVASETTLSEAGLIENPTDDAATYFAEGFDQC